MIKKKLTIINKLGLHARAAAKLVHLASKYTCKIQIHKGSKKINAKSIMGVMMLAATKGTKLEFVTDGKNEKEAAEKIAKLIKNKFDEEE